MRKDFYHILLERSRVGGDGDKPGRHTKWKDAPKRESMRNARYRKETKNLNENLQPLRRYLAKQVGRPWNKVYSEIREHLSPDSAVQKHVVDHLKWEVELHAVYDNGEYCRIGYAGLTPLRYGQLYVDKNGFLKKAPREPKRKYPERPFEQQLCDLINNKRDTRKAMVAIHGGQVYRVFWDKDEEQFTHWNVARRQHADEDFDHFERPWGLGRSDKNQFIYFFCKHYDKWRKYKSEYLNHLFNRIMTWEKK